MKLIKKLDNPFLLAAQGFIAGALLFGLNSPEISDKARAPIQSLLSITSLR